MHCFGAVVELPKAWPDPPSPMSFSTLRDIETCPRRWGLMNATYSQFENAGGYPSKPSIASLRGLVIHRVIESIVRSAKSKANGDFRHRATLAMRDSGGLSEIIRRCVEDVLGPFGENPRADYLCKSARQSQAFAGQIRVSVQQALQHLTDIPFAPFSTTKKTGPSTESRTGALARGVYVEVALNGPDDWFGKVDLLALDSGGIRIEDFKSGKPKEVDKHQMLIYAWLWWRDSARNPSAAMASRLLLKYASDSLEVTVPSMQELKRFEDEILDRTRTIRNKIDAEEFPANVSGGNCASCPVRQLCEPYWAALTSGSDSRYLDVEISVVKIESPRFWRVRIVKSNSDIESEVISLTGSLPETLADEGSIVRILDAKISVTRSDISDGGAMLYVGRTSEVHFVGPS